jgi:hypothetical protein
MRIAAIVDCCTAEPHGHDLTSKLQDMKPDAARRITRHDRLNTVIAGRDHQSRALWAPSHGAAR